MSRRRNTALADAPDEYVGVFFVARDLPGRHRLRRGQLWPSQCRADIRGWASSYGEDERAEWSSFRFVDVVLAPPAEAEAIVARGMTRDEAVAYLAAVLEGTRA